MNIFKGIVDRYAAKDLKQFIVTIYVYGLFGIGKKATISYKEEQDSLDKMLQSL